MVSKNYVSFMTLDNFILNNERQLKSFGSYSGTRVTFMTYVTDICLTICEYIYLLILHVKFTSIYYFNFSVYFKFISFNITC